MPFIRCGNRNKIETWNRNKPVTPYQNKASDFSDFFFAFFHVPLNWVVLVWPTSGGNWGYAFWWYIYTHTHSQTDICIYKYIHTNKHTYFMKISFMYMTATIQSCCSLLWFCFRTLYCYVCLNNSVTQKKSRKNGRAPTWQNGNKRRTKRRRKKKKKKRRRFWLQSADTPWWRSLIFHEQLMVY